MSQIDDAVRRLRQFLEAHGEMGWTETLVQIERDLLSADTRTSAATALRDSFGGMGSLNDIYLDTHIEPGANRQLHRLLDACYREAVLVNEGWRGRLLWHALSLANLGGISPRIRHAFK